MSQHVEVDLVAFDQVGVVEGLEAFGLLAVVAVGRALRPRSAVSGGQGTARPTQITAHEIIQMLALEGILLQREVHVGAQVVDPELLRPRLLLRGFAVEEPERSGDRQRKALGKARPEGSQKQEGQLLYVVAIRQSVIPQDASVVPELRDKGGGVGHELCLSSKSPS
jgi:hypothetical protein